MGSNAVNKLSNSSTQKDTMLRHQACMTRQANIESSEVLGTSCQLNKLIYLIYRQFYAESATNLWRFRICDHK